MDAARELFIECGTNFTIDDLVARSGISRATVFRRFGTKESVIQRTFQREIRDGIVQIVTAAAERPTATERAVELITSLLLVAVRHPILRHLAGTTPPSLSLLGASGDPSPLTMVGQIMNDALLLASAEVGRPLPLPVDQTVDILIHTIAGYTYFPYGTLADTDEEHLRAAIERFVRRLLPDVDPSRS
ncbi:bacterial regulatory s, tetR family protein [Mycolicibacterium hassiacum DSM 44199]|jgi:AcrR family transcriptional regulator|uniref:Bacterial regulatory s, tetR family protein n=2 Tax=Mycolicibacterium hassiacum TaxID=46351 RepID=K5BH97_MYCHD|nr:bacterial regulatory s, tetR family protein [Mycolicibacterium hassiacum DSM 44199]MBX5486572.1 helix-turn-helix transcriptional regulator [Mycolicibacterium hassiacum]PZN19087.1 MAG: TetR/AcrR family transcriptional regulator [Mycolicibacterium hassiacum]VCT92865.1 hypothetical protein MHAS_04600 [Mycolicibacterium hassiacum DSM 44199]